MMLGGSQSSGLDPEDSMYGVCIRSLNLLHLKMVQAEIKNYYVEVPFNGMTSLLNFMKIYQLVAYLLVEEAQADRQTSRLIS
jgi:hypothetical protein